jgi:hypothetical protein
MLDRSGYKTALKLSATVRSLKSRGRKLSESAPSMEDVSRYVGLVNAHLKPVLDQAQTVSIESVDSVETILDNTSMALNKIGVGLEGFLDLFRRKKPEQTQAEKNSAANKKYDQMVHDKKVAWVKFTDLYQNPGRVAAATMHIKETTLSGEHGGALTINGKEVDTDRIIAALKKEVADITAFGKSSEGAFNKYIEWMCRMTKIVQMEVVADRDADEYPNLTEALKKEYKKRPPAPSSIYDPVSILSVGIAADKMKHVKGHGFAPLSIPKAIVTFEPLTNKQAQELGSLVCKMVELESDLEDLSYEITDDRDGLVGFNDYPYRSEAVVDAIDAFGWDDAIWSSADAYDESDILYILGMSVVSKSEAIQLWLRNAVVGSP